MPGLVFVSCNGFLAFRITDNKAILLSMCFQPLGFFGSSKAGFRRTLPIASGHVNSKARLMLTVTGYCAVGFGLLQAVLLHITVEQTGLCLLGTVCGYPSQIDAILLGTSEHLLKGCCSLFAHLSLVNLLTERELHVRVYQVLRLIIFRQAELLVHKDRFTLRISCGLLQAFTFTFPLRLRGIRLSRSLISISRLCS
ncbi:hypothetical protein D3C72_438060 [compost metagenome]